MAIFGRNGKPEHHSSTSSLTSLSRLKFSTLARITSQRNVGSGPIGSPECDYTPRFFFKLVREGDTLIVASSSEVDRHNWMQALYRATGQTHKPTPPGASSSTVIKTDQANLSNGRFHQELANRFTPLVDRYIGLMADSIEQALIEGCKNERWIPGSKLNRNEGEIDVYHNHLR
ncbi:unnamed protein product [Heterobilharzia americana]|nr:unnamed protein product [Heterobilharzia americana]